MSVTVKLPAFEGPLDLLLHLIEKNQVDICDIPIYEITKQYLEYLDEWNHENMIIASEFIVMAATLIKIKARMLIPSEPKEEDEEDPREDLIRRLLEYKRFKEAAQQMKKLIPDADKLWITRGREKLKIPAPKPSIDQLLSSLTLESIYELYKQAMQNKADSIDPTRSTFNSVAKDSYTIDSKIRDLLDTLEHLQTISFYQLREQSHSRQEEITYFLAMLELNRSSLVYLKQENPFEDILMVPADRDSDHDIVVEKTEELSELENEKPEIPEGSDEPELETEVPDSSAQPVELEADISESTAMSVELEADISESTATPVELEADISESAAQPVELEHKKMEEAAMSVPIPTITIEPSVSNDPDLDSSAEMASERSTEEVIVLSETTDVTEEVPEISEVTETTEEAAGISEVTEETPEALEISDDTEVSEECLSSSNVIEVDFSHSSVSDSPDLDEDGSEYTERIDEDERGYSDPKKSRAAGA